MPPFCLTPNSRCPKPPIPGSRYEAQLERFCALLDPLLDAPPLSFDGPQPSRRFQGLYQRARTLSGFLGRSVKTGSRDLTALYELMVAPAAKVLDRWFESDVLKAALATDAVIGAMVRLGRTRLVSLAECLLDNVNLNRHFTALLVVRRRLTC